ncbi:MAG: hypothetical protein WC746_03080 [archaeon]|jgi:seryl-tRNA synthetase
MQRQLGLLKKKVTLAEQELNKARLRHEKREQGVDDLVNRVLSVQKTIALFESQQELLQHLSDRAKQNGQTNLAIKYETDASYLERDTQLMQQREVQLKKQIKHETGQTEEDPQKRKPLNKLEKKFDKLGRESVETRAEYDKLIKLLGPNHPETILARREFLRTNGEFNEQLWKVKHGQLQLEKDPISRGTLKRSKKRIENRVKSFDRRYRISLGNSQK